MLTFQDIEKVSKAEAQSLAEENSDIIVNFQELSAAEGLEDLRSCINTFLNKSTKLCLSKNKFTSSNDIINSTFPEQIDEVQAKSIKSKNPFENVNLFNYLYKRGRKNSRQLCMEIVA